MLSIINQQTFFVCQYSFFSCLKFSHIHRLRSLNLAWTDLSSESVQYICETIPRCIEQLNISGQRYNLIDDCKKRTSIPSFLLN